MTEIEVKELEDRKRLNVVIDLLRLYGAPKNKAHSALVVVLPFVDSIHLTSREYLYQSCTAYLPSPSQWSRHLGVACLYGKASS